MSKKHRRENLDDLHAMNAADVFAARSHFDDLSSDARRLVVHAATHEAAHFVACVACPGSYVGDVRVYYTPGKLGGGLFNGSECMPDEEYFVSLAGHAMEELLTADCQRPRGGERDYQQGYRLGYEWVLDETRAFVNENAELITKTGLATLLLANKAGGITGKGDIEALVQWVGKQVRPFKTRCSSPSSEQFLARYSPEAQAEYRKHLDLIRA